MYHTDIQFHCCVPGKYCKLTNTDGRIRPPLFNRQMGATCATLFKGYPWRLFLESYTNYLKMSSSCKCTGDFWHFSHWVATTVGLFVVLDFREGCRFNAAEQGTLSFGGRGRVSGSKILFTFLEATEWGEGVVDGKPEQNVSLFNKQCWDFSCLYDWMCGFLPESPGSVGTFKPTSLR